MVLFRFSMREVLLRPLRATLTLLSIVIGVAAIVAVSIASQTTNSAHRAVFETVTGKADLEVAMENGGRVDGSVVAALDGTPGLTAVVPVLEDKGSIYEAKKQDNGIDVQLIGIDPQRHDAVNDYEIWSAENIKSRKYLQSAHVAA